MSRYNLRKQEKPKGGSPLTVVLSIRVNPDLRAWFVNETLRTQVPMNELISEILAKHIGQPDLAKIPRKRPGSLPKPTELATA